jgi:DNA-binding NarL/FixJ family response regulator
MDAKIRVLCVDDNDLVADALGVRLAHAGGFEWLGHLAHADGLADEVERRRPDVVLLDIDMPGPDPFEALTEISRRCAAVRVLMFSGHIQSREVAERAIEAGAWGYLSKHESAEDIVSAIRRVAKGEFILGSHPAATEDG